MYLSSIKYELEIKFYKKYEILYRLKQKGYARREKTKIYQFKHFFINFYMHIIRLIANNLNEKR